MCKREHPLLNNNNNGNAQEKRLMLRLAIVHPQPPSTETPLETPILQQLVHVLSVLHILSPPQLLLLLEDLAELPQGPTLAPSLHLPTILPLPEMGIDRR